MKTLLARSAAVLIGAQAPQLLSQFAAVPKKTPLQSLQALKVENQKLLDQQAATLLKLDEIQKEATQVRFLTKRS